jgi:DNA repair exonuclease SbcCD nuclease subunit
MPAKNQLQILHISDLHIKDDSHERFDRERVLDPLIKRVKYDLAHGFAPEMVVVTGDIAFKGIQSEYDLARLFFNDLLHGLDLAPERLFMVPGNHDVNRKKYRPRDIPVYDTMSELNTELEDEEYRQDLLKGMGAYFDFVEESFPHLQPLENRLVPFVYCYTAACGRKVGLIGLNSAWMCRRSDDKGTIALGEYQV